MELKIETPDRDERLPVYFRYDRQINPQPAYIEVRPEDMIVSYDYDGEIGNAVPGVIWNSREYRVYISPFSSGESLANFLERDDVITLIERIVDGYTCDWDGSNFVGSLDEDAISAIAELRERAESEIELTPTWDGLDCLDEFSDQALGMTETTTDQELHQIVRDCQMEADDQGIALLDTDQMIDELRRRRALIGSPPR